MNEQVKENGIKENGENTSDLRLVFEAPKSADLMEHEYRTIVTGSPKAGVKSIHYIRWGNNVNKLVEIYGEKAIMEAIEDNLRISLQQGVRNNLNKLSEANKGKYIETDVISAIAEVKYESWTPELKGRQIISTDVWKSQTEDRIKAMTAEERLAYIEKVQAMV